MKYNTYNKGFTLFVIMSSCHDDLNNYPLSDHSEDKVWNSAASAQLFVNGTLYIKTIYLTTKATCQTIGLTTWSSTPKWGRPRMWYGNC